MAGVTLATFDAFLKDAYSPDRIRHLVNNNGGGSLGQLRRPSPDAYEYRITDRAQVFAKSPGYNGRIRLGPPPSSPSLAAVVALGGLGMLIARRNAVAEAEGVSTTWIAAVAEWLARLVRGLMAGSRSAADTTPGPLDQARARPSESQPSAGCGLPLLEKKT